MALCLKFIFSQTKIILNILSGKKKNETIHKQLLEKVIDSLNKELGAEIGWDVKDGIFEINFD